MTAAERFRAYLKGEALDRAPMIEWAPWWHLTVNRWLEDKTVSRIYEKNQA